MALDGLRAVLLDALGTLVELRSPWKPLAEALALRHGLDIPVARARAALEVEMSFYRAHHHRAVDGPSLTALRHRCAAVLRDALGEPARHIGLPELTETLLSALQFQAYPDAAPALSGLAAAGMRLAVVSNWDVSLHEVLRRTGLDELVHEVVTSAEAGVAKPAPAIFELALTRLGVAPRHALAVGDSPEHDVAGARAAGISPLLLVRAGVSRPEHAGATCIGSLSELVSLST